MLGGKEEVWPPRLPPKCTVLIVLSWCIACAPSQVTDRGVAQPRFPAMGNPSQQFATDLPLAGAVNTDEFAGAATCTRCHTANQTVMRDRKGRDVSQIAEWSVSMMGLSARDPYFLAALSREIQAQPDRQAEISAFCLGCHAPMATVVAGAAQTRPITLGDLMTSSSPAAQFGREGVTCVACHSQSATVPGDASRLGKPPTLVRNRVVYGSLKSPLSDAMKQMIHVEPQYGAHIADSRLCAGCHTVLVPAAGQPVGQQIVEQGTYFEWQASGFSTERPAPQPYAQSCIGCHMPTVDDDAVVIRSAYSTRPVDAPVRDSFSRHTMQGGSTYLLRQLAQFVPWLAAGVSAEQLLAASQRTETWLRQAAALALHRTADIATITVTNLTGHKLPTGFSSRRMWLMVTVSDRHGDILLQSGQHQHGKIFNGESGITAHQTELSITQSVPQIWQSVPVDPSGKVTHLLMNVARWGKDNRILPQGWRSDRASADIAPVGVTNDVDFTDGEDRITVRLPASAAKLQVQLLYQAIPPDAVASYEPSKDAVVSQFLRIVAEPEQPTVMAEQTITW